MRVRNMTSTNGNKVANQFVIENGNQTVFQSYDSSICSITRGQFTTVSFGEDWDYSRTTSKYLNMFLKEYAPSLTSTPKALFEECKRYGNGTRVDNGYEIYFEELN